MRGEDPMRSHREPVAEPVNAECHVTASPVMEAALAQAGFHPPVGTDYGIERSGKRHDQIQASSLSTRLELLRKTLRLTPHVWLSLKGMSLFAKLEYVNPIGSIKDRAAYWILKRAA